MRRALRLEVVGDEQARPARLDRHRVRQVALAQRQAVAVRLDGEVAGALAAEQVGEHRGRVRAGVAQPGQLGVRGEQRDRPLVGQHRQPLDRRRRLAVEPVAALLQQEAEHQGDVHGVGHAERGEGLAVADLDAQVRAGQPGERLLVGDVVAEEDRRRGADLVAQDVQRAALVRLDDRQLDHLLAVGGRHAFPRGRSGVDGREHPAARLVLGAAHVHRDAGRLDLERHARDVQHQLFELGLQPPVQLPRLLVERVDEADVELGAVAADEVHLGRQPRERGEVTQRAAGDDGGGGLVQTGERSEGPTDSGSGRASSGLSVMGASVPS